MANTTEKHQSPAAQSLHVIDEHTDPAQQSLADALRTSFRILKLAMIILVVAYFASGMFTVEQNKQAVVLRLGSIVGDVRDPGGVHWAFPPPIDQVIEIPVKKSSTLDIDSQWLYLTDQEKKKPLSQIIRGSAGLHPVRDGVLLTGDKGLVHVKWRVVYRIEDLIKYVSVVADEDYTEVQPSKVEILITKLLEHAAIDVAGGFTTDQAARKGLNELQELVKRRVNDDLRGLGTGVVVEAVVIRNATPPLQTKLAFDQVMRAENKKNSTISEARQSREEILNETAGPAHARLTDLLDEHDTAQAAGDDQAMVRLSAELDRVVEFEASGSVGSLIRESKGYYTSVVQGMRADAERYDTLLPEWRERPDLLKTRVWEQTKQRLFSRAGITKLYRPLGVEFRIHLGTDPRQRELEERRQYEDQSGDEEVEHVHYEPKYPGGEIR